MIEQYRQTEDSRLLLGVEPLPLTRQQVQEVTLLLEQRHAESEFLLGLLQDRVEIRHRHTRTDGRWL